MARRPRRFAASSFVLIGIRGKRKLALDRMREEGMEVPDLSNLPEFSDSKKTT